MAKYKIALICFKPNDIYLDFLNKFSNYEVYIIIDDNSVNYSALYCTKYNNLKFIQMPERICINYGFTNVNRIGVKKRVSGWDKALCYFAFNTNVNTNVYTNVNTNVNTNVYTNVKEKIWFVEDDVFFHSEDTLLKIDAKYPDCDLLSNCDFKPATNMNEWLWPIIQIKIESPYYCGMMCAIRLSQNVLDRIRDYATLNKELFFLEALFPTLSKELNCCCPDELKTVVYRHDYTYEKVSLDKDKGRDNIYHPVKNILKHDEFRK
jgi:hypothetical protein